MGKLRERKTTCHKECLLWIKFPILEPDAWEDCDAQEVNARSWNV